MLGQCAAAHDRDPVLKIVSGFFVFSTGCDVVRLGTVPASVFEPMQISRMRKLSILLGAILLAFVCSLLLVSSTSFFFGVPISWFDVPVAAAMAAGFGWWGVNFYFPQERIRVFGLLFGSAVISFLLFAWLSSRIYDISWDGQTYHAEGIAQLANGWNPFREASPSGLVIHTYPWFFPIYLAFFPKAPWICAAALYKFSGSFESGKVFHLTLILACFLFSFAALSTFRSIKGQWRLTLSLLIAFNPVSVCQMFTYYVDGQLASLLAITVGLLVLIYRRPDRVLMVVLTLVVTLMINVKLTGALYVFILAGGYWLFYAVVKKAHRAELTACLAAGGILGGGFVGFSPYVTQFIKKLITTGNPFHPYAGWTSVVGLESPEIFGNNMDRVRRLAVSLFSKSEVLPIPSFKLKPPFTFSLDEIQAFAFPDVRMGGFGPLFSGAIVLSVAILVVLFSKYRWRLLCAAHLLVLMGLIFISALSLSESWWARYAPQVWMLPLLTAIVGLLITRRGLSRGLAFALLLLLFANNLLISYEYTIFTARYSELAAQQLGTLKKQEQPIPAKFGIFSGVRHRFERKGIRYVEVENLPCAKDKQKEVILSPVSICMPEETP